MEETVQKKRSPIVILIALHVLLFLYSLSSLSSKFASQQATFSLPFFMWYAAVLVILVLYALGWQQVLKYTPLTVAYANKAITVVWGIMWGMVFFGEKLTPPMVIGGVLIIAGIVLFSIEDHKSKDGDGTVCNDYAKSERAGKDARS